MGELATDSFTRADLGTLGANWTKLSGFSDLRITSNACKASVSSPDCVDAYTGAGAVAVDQYAQCTYNAVPDGGPIVRANTVSTFYLVDASWITDTIVYKCITGTFTSINNVSFALPMPGDTVYLEVRGTTILSKQNGTTRHNFTDSAINGSTVGGPYPGLHASGTSIVHDNFAMGNFAAAGGGILPKMQHYT